VVQYLLVDILFRFNFFWNPDLFEIKESNFLYFDNFSTILIGYCTLWIRFVFETQNVP
jgi:hypothetical protein